MTVKVKTAQLAKMMPRTAPETGVPDPPALREEGLVVVVV
jgi:hypothetical protein